MVSNDKQRILFGTDGIRGQANQEPMTATTVLKLGQVIGTYFREHYRDPRVLIGKDTRESGYMLEQALSSGICSVGVDTFFLGPLPTPGIAYLTQGLRANAGIVISASHNPFQDNGIKIFSADGYKLPDNVEKELEQLYLSPSIPTCSTNIGRTRRIDDAVGQYAVFLKEQFPKKLSLENIHIVLDCANGASYRVAPKVFTELGAELTLIGNTPDGCNINAACGATAPRRLQQEILNHKADIGIALDGDADRLVVVDADGSLLDGDELMAIFARNLLAKNQLRHKTLVTTVMSNMGLDRALAKMGGQVVRCRVGDRYVMETMRAGNYNLGGEQSGHIIFHDCATSGDGILAALNLLEILVESQRPLRELRRCITKLPQVLRSVDVNHKPPLADTPTLAKALAKAEASLGNRGRIVFRYSGTEAKARIMVEGDNIKEIETMAAELAHLTKEQSEEAAR